MFHRFLVPFFWVLLTISFSLLLPTFILLFKKKKKKGIFLKPEYYAISHSKLPKSTVLTFLLGFWLSGIIWKQKGKSKTDCGAVIIVPYSIIIIHFYNESHVSPYISKATLLLTSQTYGEDNMGWYGEYMTHKYLLSKF